MTATVPQPGAALFIADDAALDFINTAYGIEPDRVEVLTSDQCVLDWLDQAGLSLQPQSRVQLQGLPSAGKPGTLLRSALALRDCARDLVERRKAGTNADPSVLNRVLASAEAHQELIWRRGQAPVFRTVRMGSKLEAALVPLAEAIARLLAEGDFELVRHCESTECTLWFYDRTKSHQRRWCSMALCGNRAKVAAFRERRKKS